MNADQVAALLAYASAADPRIRRNDPDERRLQIRFWHGQLAAMDFDAACRAVEAHYSRAGVDAVLPGDVRQGAKEHPSSRPLAEVIRELPASGEGPGRAEYRQALAEFAAKRALPGGA